MRNFVLASIFITLVILSTGNASAGCYGINPKICMEFTTVTNSTSSVSQTGSRPIYDAAFTNIQVGIQYICRTTTVTITASQTTTTTYHYSGGHEVSYSTYIGPLETTTSTT